MHSVVQGAILSAIGVFVFGIIGFTHSLWDWCFWGVGIIAVIRYNIASFKHANRTRMLAWLEKIGDKFSNDEKIYLTEASGIIMPPIMLWSQFLRVEASAACFWCNLLSVVLFIISIILGDYGSACVALLIFLSNYGQWPWQPGKFYTGYTDIDIYKCYIFVLQESS